MAERHVFKWDAQQQRVVRVGHEAPAEQHYVQDDTIEPTMSHATSEGKVFTSRSALEAHYKEHGFECTGGAHLTGRGAFDNRYKADREDIRRDAEIALNQLRWGMAPVNERERETCQLEERDYRDYQRRQRR